MPNHVDHVWSPSPKAHPLPVYAQSKPNETWEEQLVSRALAASQVPGEILQQEVRPPLPQIQKFPPRFGYRQEAFRIEDVVNVDLIYRRYDFTGSQSGYSASSYPSLWNW